MLLRYGASLDSCRGQQSVESVLAEEVTLKVRLEHLAPWTTGRDYGDLPATLVVLFSGVRSYVASLSRVAARPRVQRPRPGVRLPRAERDRVARIGFLAREDRM